MILMLVKKRAYTAWYKNSLLHKEDGPALIYWDGQKRWYIEGDLTGSESNGKLVERVDR